MKTRNIIKLMILGMAWLPNVASAQAGHVGGGNVVVCDQKIELLDLYEVQLRPGLKEKMSIIRSNDSVEEQVENAFSKLAALDSDLGKQIAATYSAFNSDLVPIADQYAWAATNDLGLLPDLKCPLANVINYLSDDVAEIKSNLYDKLSNTDKAALRVHEVLYKIARKETNARDSLAVRRMVALLFSDLDDKYLLGSLLASYLFSAEKRGVLVKASPEDYLSTMHMETYKWDIRNDGSNSLWTSYSFRGFDGSETVKKGFLGYKIHTGRYKLENFNFEAMPTINMNLLCKGFNNTLCTIDAGLWIKDGNGRTVTEVTHIMLNNSKISLTTGVRGFSKKTVPIRLVSPKVNAFITGSLKE